MASKADEVEAGEAGLPRPEAPYSVHLVVEIHGAGNHSASLEIRPHSQTNVHQAMCSAVSRQYGMPIPREQKSDDPNQKTEAGMLPQHLLIHLISQENAKSRRNAQSGLNPYRHLRIPSKSLAPSNSLRPTTPR
jgi:hypothetical protein